jgi:serine O-acetyltransferase
MSIFVKLRSYVMTLRLIPHVIVFYTSNKKTVLEYELNRWLELYHLDKKGLKGLLLLLNSLPEYRSLFYFRTGAYLLQFLAKGQTNLYFYVDEKDVEPGMMIWHGFSTVINANHIGRDFQVWHNVTIGKKTSLPLNDRPTIGNNVRISAGAVAIGDIKIADNSIVGAGAVVTKNVPNPGTVVVSQPSRYILHA